MDALNNLVPKDKQALLLKGRGMEIRQPLLDLGYWMPGGSLEKALSEFREDYKIFRLVSQLEQLPEIDESTSEMDSVELQILHLLTSLDGDFNVERMPGLGVLNLTTRVIHYRLTILGIYEGLIKSSFSNKTLTALKQLWSWLHEDQHNNGMEPTEQDLTKVINWTGDFITLLLRVQEGSALRQKIVCFKYTDPQLDASIVSEIKEEEETNWTPEELQKAEAEIDKEIDTLIELSEVERKAIHKNLKGQNKQERRLEKIEHIMTLILKRQDQQIQAKRKAKAAQIENLSIIKAQESSQIATIEATDTELAQAIKDVKSLNAELQNIGNKSHLKEQLSQKQKERNLKLNNVLTDALQNEIRSLQQEVINLEVVINKLQEEIDNMGMGAAKKKKRKAKKEKEKTKKDKEKHCKICEKELEVRLQLQQLSNNIKRIDELSVDIQVKTERREVLKVTLSIHEKDLKELRKSNKRLEQKIAETEAEIKAIASKHQHDLKDKQERRVKLQEKISNFGPKFKTQLKKSLEDSYFKEVRREIFTNRNKTYLESIIADPINRFLIRLLQVHQWMNGYYYGLLDSDLKKRTFDSIYELCKDVKELKFKHVVTMLGDESSGFWILNIQHFVTVILQNLQKLKKANSEDLIIRCNEKLDVLEKHQQLLEEKWEDFNIRNEHHIMQGKIRRVYYGVRMLATSLLRGFVRLINLIVGAVKKIISLLDNFIKFIYRELREGMLKFGQGMAFLFGKRELETPIPNTNQKIITKYTFDFDAVTILPPTADAAICETHKNYCINRAKNLDFSLQLVAKVLKWIFRFGAGPISWLRLLLKVAFHYKKILIRFLMKIKNTFRQLKLATPTV